MNRELKISIADLCIGYGCTAVLMYAIGGIAYCVGKSRAKIEISNNLRDFLESHTLVIGPESPRK